MLAAYGPPSPWTVSTITAATSPSSPSGREHRVEHVDAVSIAHLAVIRDRVAVCSRGTPADWRLLGLAVTASEPRVMPWKALVKATTVRRPVTLRASSSAAAAELMKVGPGNCTR